MKIFVLFIFLALTNVGFSTTIEFKGVITELPWAFATSGQYEGVELGDIIKGSFTYDPNDSFDRNDWDAVGSYYYNNSNSSFSLSFYDVSNNNSLLYEYDGHINKITTFDDWEYTPSPGLYPMTDGMTTNGLLENGSQVYLRLLNYKPNLDLIITDELPSHPLALDQYNQASGSITLYKKTGQFEFIPTHITVVPEPSFYLMLMCSTSLIFFKRKKTA